jgi:hypothetical protein
LDALSKLRQRNRLHATLKSGLNVAYHLPDVKRCLIDAQEIQGSDSRKAWEYYRRVVADMLEAVEGEEITDRDDRFAIVAALTPDERSELDALASPQAEVELVQGSDGRERLILNGQGVEDPSGVVRTG